jgi:hypothetical protein
MADITLLPSAKVPLIYPDTSGMTTEWYRFFWNVYGFTGDATGTVPVSKGGTGLNSIGEHQLIIGNSSGLFERTELIGSGITITYGPGTTTLAIGNSGVTPGTYGSASAVGQFTVDSKGTLVFAQNVPIAIDATQIISGTIASARISGSYTGITGVGTLTAGTWNATTIGTAYGGTGLISFTSGGALYATSSSVLTSGTLPVTAGGTGQSSFTNGQLLIGNTTGNTLDKATLTAGTAINIANGAGAITITNTLPDQTVVLSNGTGISVTGTYPSFTITNTAPSSGGTVTSVTGTSPVVSSGGTTPAISLATAYGDTLNPYASKTANYFLAAPNGSAGVPTFRAIVAADIPALSYVTSVSGTGTVNGITLTGTVTSSGSLTLGGTLGGIGNSQLTNSTISGVALGGNLFNLTAGTGVSFSTGTTYNGSAAITINATGTGGTVTSVAATVPSFLSVSGSPITTSGTLAITLSGTALPVANGGTGLTSLTTGYIPFGAGTSAFDSSANLFWDNTNSRLGIGTSSPSTKLNIYDASVASVLVQSDSTVNVIVSRASTDTSGGALAMRKARGTIASPLAVASGDIAGQILYQAFGGTNNRNVAIINGYVSTYTSDTDISGYLTFSTTPTGSITASERMRIDSSGNVGIGTTSPGALLHVSNASAKVRIGLTASSAYLDIFRDNATGYSVYNAAQAATFRGHIWQLGGTEAMRIDSSGLVGIGTSSPVTKLQITVAPATTADDGMRVTDGTRIIESNITGATYSYIGIGASETMLYSTGNPLNIVSDGQPIKFIAGTAERMRIPSAGGVQAVTTISVGNATPSSSGAGITFPATQSASTDANTLDDYEEGTWTPADASGAGLSFTSVDARYTKIGNLVTVYVVLTYPVTASGSQAKISGLPFTPSVFGLCLLLTPANSSGPGQAIAIASTTLSLYSQNALVKTNVNMSGLTAYISGTYAV